jgi:hypothetical protein
MLDDADPRAEMVCGHAITSEAMCSLLKSLVSDQKYRILCPDIKCQKEWDF